MLDEIVGLTWCNDSYNLACEPRYSLRIVSTGLRLAAARAGRTDATIATTRVIANAAVKLAKSKLLSW